MHILIVTPHLMQGSTLSFALKRHNFTTLIVSPLSLSYSNYVEADGIVFPHPLIKEQWNMLEGFFRSISTGVPLIFLQRSERRNMTEKRFEHLLKQSIFLDPSIQLSQIPFFIREIVQKCTPQRDVKIGRLTLDRCNRKVSHGQQSISLSRKEFYLFELFLLNSGRIISRDYIIDYVWDKRDYVAQNTIDVYISRLRKKLTPIAPKPLIRTIPCLGYQLDL